MNADIQQILTQLVQMLSGGSHIAPQTNAYSSTMYSANTGGVQAPMLQAMLGSLMPGMQPQVPPTMLMGDFRERQRRDAMRSQTIDASYLSPVALRMAQAAGMQESQLKGEDGRLNWKGNLLASTYNATLGPMMGDPWLAKGQMANQMRDIYSGQVFGSRTGRGVSFGMSEPEIQTQVTGMFGKSHGTNSIFNQGTFAAKEMFEVQRMGSERGMFVGANESDIQRRTEGLAKTIKAGQAIFNTMDKEGVLDAIQDITQGQVPLSDTGSINTIMYKVAAMARSANVSIELMKDLAAQGAALYKQVGIGGIAGAQTHMGVARRAQISSADFGAGVGAGISADTIARAGGQRVFSALLQEQAVSQLGSSGVQQNLYLLQQMKAMGLEGADEMMGKFQGAGLTERDQVNMMRKLSAAKGVSFGTVSDMMQMGGGQATEDFISKHGEGKLLEISGRRQFEEFTRGRKGLFGAEALGDASKDEARIASYAAQYRRATGKSWAESKLVAEHAILAYSTAPADSLLGKRQAENRAGLQKDEDRRALTLESMKAFESGRPSGGFLERFSASLKGDLGASSVFQALKFTLMTDPATGAALASGLSAGEIQRGQAVEAMMSHGGKDAAGMELHSTISALLGRGDFNKADVQHGVERMSHLMENYGKEALSDSAVKNKTEISKMIETGGLTLRTLRKIESTFGVSQQNSMRIAEEGNKTLFSDLKSRTSVIKKNLVPGEGGTSALDKMLDSQKYSSEVKASLDRIMSGKGTDEDLRIAHTDPSLSGLKSTEEIQKHVTDGVERAEKQQREMAVAGGADMKAKGDSPVYASAVGVAAKKAAGMTSERLESSLRDLGLSMEGGVMGQLAREAKGLKRSLGAGELLGKVSKALGGRQLSEEEAGVFLEGFRKKTGMGFESLSAGSSSLGALTKKREEGYFSEENMAKRDAEEQKKAAKEATEYLKQIWEGISKWLGIPIQVHGN